MTPDEVVTGFLNAFDAGDSDAMRNYLDENCFYHNVPLEPITGAGAMIEALEGFLQILGPIKVDVLHQSANGNVVMNERIDSFDPPEGKAYGLPLMGIFEVSGDKITSWKDYFDMGMFSKGSGIEF